MCYCIGGRVENSSTDLQSFLQEEALSITPDRLGKYEFQQFLGKGNIGEVWKARDLSTRRDVALKIVYADLQRSDPQFLTRFMTDGQVLVALRHANLVPTLEVNITRQERSKEITAYIAMEYIVGRTFASYLENTSHKSNFPALSAIINFFTSLGLALDYAYERMIVHGNLTPDNILLNQQDTSHFPGGEPMLTDTGLAEILGSATNTYTKAPLYLSPEQAQGYPPGPRSDVYALGVILYEIYTGTLPFRGESSVALMSQHIRTLPTPPALINPIVPSALSEVILRAMAKDPIARFPNISTFAAALADASTIPSSFFIGEPPPPEDVTPVRQENSLLGVAQPPSLPGSSQFRFSGQPSLSGLAPWEGLHKPVLPSTPSAFPLQSQSIFTNPLPSDTDKPVQSPTPQPPAAQGRSTVTLPPLTPDQTIPQPPAVQVRSTVTLPPLTPDQTTPQPPAVQDKSALSLPPLTSGQPIPTTDAPQKPPIPFSPEPIEPKGLDAQTQAFPQSAISRAPESYIPNPGANISQSVNTQYRQQGQPAFNADYAGFSPASAAQISQMPPRPQTTPLGQAQQLPPIPTLPEQRGRKKSSGYIALIAILALIIIGGTLGAIFLLTKGNTNQAASGNGGNRVFFQDGTLHNDQLRINLQNIAPPPDGQTYFAWLRDTTQQTQPLGALSAQNGNVSFVYQGDSKHTNLISITQGILITTEDIGKTPQVPSDHKVYQASFDPQFLDGLKYLLYATPGLPDQQSIVATILDTLHSIDDKAGSIADSLNHDNVLVMRQATRIIELLDNSQQAQKSGDLPAQYPSQIAVAIGLLSSPTQPGYLDILDTQLKQLEPLVAHNTNAQQHLTNIKSALGDLRDWLKTMHDYDVQLLQAASLQDPKISSTVFQLKQISVDSFTGRTIPPNASPQPVPGSAGAQQAYTEAQYMATLDLQPA